MLGILRQLEYRAQIEKEIAKRKPAFTQNLTHCIRCGYCCITRTCIPHPNEMPIIAKFLKLTTQELISQYMVGDELGGHYFLRWANIIQLDLLGKFLPLDRTYDVGQCIFYNEEKRECKIYPVCPEDAKLCECWSDKKLVKSENFWKKGDLEKFCPDMEIN
jgi:Fe-S-cluster containining protein